MEMIEDFAKGLKRDLGVLINDIGRIVVKKNKKTEKASSTKNTIMPITNLYENKNTIEELKKDPDVDFIINATNHIFGKYL